MKNKAAAPSSGNAVETSPLQTEFLIGRNRERNFLFEGLTRRRLHHSICLSGPKGIGKMTTICSAVKDAFSFFEKETGANFNSAKMIADNIHPDVLILQPHSDSAKKEISTDQIRNLIEFAFLKPSCFSFKVIIIDSLDDLNINSSNALLKILEEPQGGTIFLTTYHTDKTILKTIRSRCVTTFCHPLEERDFYSVLKNFIPDIDENAARTLGVITKSNASMAIEAHQYMGLEGYEMLIKDLINKTSQSLTFFKKIEDLGLDRYSFLRLFISRVLNCLAYFSCGIKNKIVSTEENSLLDYSQKLFMAPLEIVEKTKQITEIMTLGQIYGTSFHHMLLTILSILRSNKTSSSSIQNIYRQPS